MNFVACLFQLVNFHKSSVQISNNIEGAMKMIVSFWPKLHQKLARINKVLHEFCDMSG